MKTPLWLVFQFVVVALKWTERGTLRATVFARLFWFKAHTVVILVVLFLRDMLSIIPLSRGGGLCRQMCLCTRWVSLSFSLLHFNVGLGHFADYSEVNKQREGLCRVTMSVYNR